MVEGKKQRSDVPKRKRRDDQGGPLSDGNTGSIFVEFVVDSREYRL
jgi:hypothetical protein